MHAALSHEELATLWYPPTEAAQAERMQCSEFTELEAPEPAIRGGSVHSHESEVLNRELWEIVSCRNTRPRRRIISAVACVFWYTVSMITLPAELQDMVENSGDAPVRVVDPRTQRVYVLIADEQFDRLRSLLDMEPLSLDQQRIALSAAGRRAGWDDPEMDVYDNYDAHRPQP